MTAFTKSTFVENSDLCGAPLVTKCQDDDPNKSKVLLKTKMMMAILINGFI